MNSPAQQGSGYHVGSTALHLCDMVSSCGIQAMKIKVKDG